MKKIKIGTLVKVTGPGGLSKGTGEVMGYEYVVGLKGYRVVVRILRTGETIKVLEKELEIVLR